jgi:hypothetical protein
MNGTSADLGANIEDDADTMEGWLKKRGAVGLVKSYKDRFFELAENQLNVELKYYADFSKQKLKGQVNLNEVLEIRNLEKFRFDIVMSNSRVFELDAPDAEQKQRWLKIISSKSEVPISGAEVAGAGSGGANYQIQGYLLKLSGGSFGEGKKYQRRFFRLRNDDDAQVLQYFVSLRPIPKP